MAQTKFFRGVDEASLPLTKRDGAIYIIDPNPNSIGDSRGKMFVDIGTKRLEISSPLSPVEFNVYTKAQIDSMGSNSSTLGEIYLITDNDELVGFKIGDGNAYIADLPTNNIYTDEDKQTLQDLVNSVSNIESKIANGVSVNYRNNQGVNNQTENLYFTYLNNE